MKEILEAKKRSYEEDIKKLEAKIEVIDEILIDLAVDEEVEIEEAPAEAY